MNKITRQILWCGHFTEKYNWRVTTFLSITRPNPVSRDLSNCCNSSIFKPWRSSPLSCLYFNLKNYKVLTFQETREREKKKSVVTKYDMYMCTLVDGSSRQLPCSIWSSCCFQLAAGRVSTYRVSHNLFLGAKSHLYI